MGNCAQTEQKHYETEGNIPDQEKEIAVIPLEEDPKCDDDDQDFFSVITIDKKEELEIVVLHLLRGFEKKEIIVPISDFSTSYVFKSLVKKLKISSGDSYEDVLLSDGTKLKERLTKLKKISNSYTPGSEKITRAGGGNSSSTLGEAQEQQPSNFEHPNHIPEENNYRASDAEFKIISPRNFHDEGENPAVLSFDSSDVKIEGPQIFTTFNHHNDHNEGVFYLSVSSAKNSLKNIGNTDSLKTTE